MTRLLICGSRDTTDAMLTYARNCTLKAIDNGWSLLTGDAIGVDKAVAETVAPMYTDLDGLPRLWLKAYGIQDAPRHAVTSSSIDYYNILGKRYMERITTYGKHDVHVWVVPRLVVVDYATRDQYIVYAADKVMCIWNGTSKGTIAVYKFALSLGKEAWLKRF